MLTIAVLFGIFFLQDPCFSYLAFSCPLGCPAGWSAHGNSCYHILDSPTQKMSDARLKCQNMGGDLVIIRSAQENDFIFELVEKLNKVFGVWLGLQRKADSKFYWIDDTPVEGNYQNWNLGEPNDNGGIEDCGHMYGKGSSAGKWNDSPCDWGVVPLRCLPEGYLRWPVYS